MDSSVHTLNSEEKVISVAFLTRKDLTKYNSNRHFNSISYYHFRSAVLNIDDINKCELIVFRDNGRNKVLKTRF